ncbi:hypothetical protein [Flagellimonas aequoris]|uniref:Uncharacterized protein n=1 Tax=Flagellimonas aequoris TaxID=2306997 RepID=A0A418N7M2_9FLAO|nr:hypothetical protein [Allomuricauda aequoris]RIV70830.1 hypothetical protein D2U88_10765 [Allomuricauda aequoris]TXK02268.1 hypothetical protein FQ019_10680 [Allomuricauda aequoris]
MRKVIFGLLFMFSFVLSANNPYDDEEAKTCGEWAADILEVIEEESGCMSASDYNSDYNSLVKYCANQM